MSTTVNKTLTILDVKDHLGKALTSASLGFNKLDQQSSKFVKDFDNRFGGMSDKIGKGMRLAGAGVLAGAGLIATGMTLALQKTKEFEHQFLELKNLNLDKTDAQIKGLRDSILTASSDTGKAATDMSKAFFDIQSGTGLFGADVDKIARKTADFSTATKVNFSTAVEGAIKGIRNFNLEASDMDMFFASMAKTVQVGIVTFDQLAKVQTDYAGAANAAGQSVDSANKLFAVFTTKTKSAEEAATLTKGAFQDLLKPATLAAFEKAGVSAFDKTTGKVMQIDQIVKQLNKSFGGAKGNDRALSGLINQFTGNEGLMALIQEAAKNGEAMMKTFEDFDKTPFSLEQALKNAKGDMATLSEMAKNRFETAMVRIGDIALPMVIKGLQFMNDTILPEIANKLPAIELAFNRIASALGTVWNGLDGFAGRVQEARYLNNFDGAGDTGRKKLLDYGFSQKDMDRMDDSAEFRTLQAIEGADKEGLKGKELMAGVLKRLQESGVGKLEGGDIAQKLFMDKYASRKAKDDYFGNTEAERIEAERFKKEQEKIKKEQDKIKEALDKNKEKGGGGSGGSNIRQGLQSVVGGGEATRNVTVNIQKLVGIENFTTNNLKEGVAAVENAMREALIKSIRDTEVAISGN